ncbi:MAG: R3H domain-containing nucleic acid-binding protein [Myxococcota bacterium]|nr:R3H domain-containing nucleic acid-binding protein [Myxococcota bacterium]
MAHDEDVRNPQAGIDFLNGVFEHLDSKVTVALGEPDDDQYIYVLTDDVSTLQARPDLVSAITLLTGQHLSRVEGRRVDAILDVGGSFEQRKSLLETLASDLQNAVEKSGRIAVVQGLSSAERKVIHHGLKDIETVRTRSEGDERARILIVEQSTE